MCFFCLCFVRKGGYCYCFIWLVLIIRDLLCWLALQVIASKDMSVIIISAHSIFEISAKRIELKMLHCLRVRLFAYNDETRSNGRKNRKSFVEQLF